MPDTNASPIAKIEMYHAIYFKDIEKEIMALKAVYYPMVQFILDIAAEAIKGNVANMDKFSELQKPINDALIELRIALTEKYTEEIGL